MQGKIELECIRDIPSMPDDTSIRVSKTTKSRLAKFGHVDDSYDDVIVRLMDKSEKCDKEHQREE